MGEEYVCTACGERYDEFDPPCKSCANEEFAKVIDTDRVDRPDDVDYVCQACGRSHTRNNPPCTRCGGMDYVTVRSDVSAAPNTTAPSEGSETVGIDGLIEWERDKSTTQDVPSGPGSFEATISRRHVILGITGLVAVGAGAALVTREREAGETATAVGASSTPVPTATPTATPPPVPQIYTVAPLSEWQTYGDVIDKQIGAISPADPALIGARFQTLCNSDGESRWRNVTSISNDAGEVVSSNSTRSEQFATGCDREGVIWEQALTLYYDNQYTTRWPQGTYTAEVRIDDFYADDSRSATAEFQVR